MSLGNPVANSLGPPAEADLLRVSLAMGVVELRAGGVSMRPGLRAGDTVRVVRRAPARGEIVLAVADGHMVLHRVVRRRAGECLLQGDARPRPDGWVASSDVLGVAVARRVRPGERGEAWRPLDRPVDRWIGLVWLHATAPFRRARAARVAPRAAPKRAAAPPPAESRGWPARRA